ncbi:MAG: methanogenesis marker 14 protein [Candidatus Thorarchaeota archaeon]|nr:methanogenesis marker 14 protein [Candidatus Thorarchaeota archaeon]
MTKKDRVIQPRSIGVSSLRRGPFYTVASVELGNTTTKCILTTTNLHTAEIYEIEKEVRLTRDVRPPLPEENVFGRTIFGIGLTRESVSEMITDVLTTVLKRARLDIERDLHFVVRSTGVTAGFANPMEVGVIVQALADGCLNAGVPPRKMTASLSADNLPPDLQDFTWLKKVYFDGAVASSLPPSDTGIVANEMEGELVTAGIKGAAKSIEIDFRNPVMTLDFGTTLAGRITDNGYPYAKTIGSFAGLAGAIPDSLVRLSGLVPEKNGSVLDIPHSGSSKRVKVEGNWIQEVERLIRVERVQQTDTRFGTVPVNGKSAEDAGVLLIGVDVGINGSNLKELEQIGRSIAYEAGAETLLAVIDQVQANVVQRILSIVDSEGFIFENTSLGLTGRSIITGQKPRMIVENLKLNNGELWASSHDLLFVEDGLAMGAAVAARCMNSMGTTRNPMGGRKGDRCIMAERMKLQDKGRG